MNENIGPVAALKIAIAAVEWEPDWSDERYAAALLAVLDGKYKLVPADAVPDAERLAKINGLRKSGYGSSEWPSPASWNAAIDAVIAALAVPAREETMTTDARDLLAAIEGELYGLGTSGETLVRIEEAVCAVRSQWSILFPAEAEIVVTDRVRAGIPADAERRLLDYWWNHGGPWRGEPETNGVDIAGTVLRDLRLALAARCPTAPHIGCTVDHEAALATLAPPKGEPLDLDGRPFCPTGYAARYHAIRECNCPPPEANHV
jgi:hypothetical protein